MLGRTHGRTHGQRENNIPHHKQSLRGYNKGFNLGDAFPKSLSIETITELINWCFIFILI